jgi:thiol-disulfide isomerase/thioredoxin
MRRVAVFALTVAALIATVGACAREPAEGPTLGVVAVDEPLPLLEGETLGGRALSTDRFAGDVLVMNVWASWCGPCMLEQPGLVRLADRYRHQGVAFLGIDYADDHGGADAWIRRYDVPYPSLYDRAGGFADDLEFPFVPHTLVVDRTGTIRYRIYGEANESELGGLVDEMLAEPAPASTSAAQASASAPPDSTTADPAP